MSGIHRKRKRTVGMERPLRRDGEEEDDDVDANEDEEGDATALVTVLVRLPAVGSEASRFWDFARERCISSGMGESAKGRDDSTGERLQERREREEEDNFSLFFSLVKGK